MKSVPSLLFFKPMKEEPTVFPFGPFAEMIVVPKRPYRPGEKCYVREAWCPYDCGHDWVEVCYRDLYNPDIEGSANDQGAVRRFPADEKTVELFQRDIEKQEVFGEKWRSPVTMPQWAARHFVTIVSCEPVRVEEVTEEDAKATGILSDSYDGLKVSSYKYWFLADFRKRHPGKWAWRVESKED